MASVAAPDVPDASTPTFHGDVALLLARLAERGFDRVVIRELPADHLDVSVVRVFVPGLEGYRFAWIDSGSARRRVRPDALARVICHAAPRLDLVVQGGVPERPEAGTGQRPQRIVERQRS